MSVLYQIAVTGTLGGLIFMMVVQSYWIGRLQKRTENMSEMLSQHHTMLMARRGYLWPSYSAKDADHE